MSNKQNDRVGAGRPYNFSLISILPFKGEDMGTGTSNPEMGRESKVKCWGIGSGRGLGSTIVHPAIPHPRPGASAWDRRIMTPPKGIRYETER